MGAWYIRRMSLETLTSAGVEDAVERVSSRYSPEEVATEIDKLLDALPETLALLQEERGDRSREDKTLAINRAEAAREFARGVSQAHESMRESVGEIARSKQEYESLLLMAQFETLAKALAEAYGAVADIESAAPEKIRERLKVTTDQVMSSFADIPDRASDMFDEANP